jgi:magnesium-transporting ATPase (P-type)
MSSDGGGLLSGEAKQNYGASVNPAVRRVTFGIVPPPSDDDAEVELVSDNKVITSKYTMLNFVPKSLLLQFRRFANIWFLFQTIIMVLGYYTNLFGAPFSPWAMFGMLVVVLSIVMVFEARDDIFRHSKDRETNEREAIVFRYENGHVERKVVAWQDIRVGDVSLVQNKEAFPADMVLMSSSEEGGLCYIETSNIDGETNLKLHIPSDIISDPFRAVTASAEDPFEQVEQVLQSTKMDLNVDLPNQYINKFAGNCKFTCATHSDNTPLSLNAKNLLLRGALLRNTRWVIGLVVYTGDQSKVMMNSQEAVSKMSAIEKIINHTLYMVVFAQCALVTITVVARMIWEAEYLSDPEKLWYLFPPGTEMDSYDLPSWLANWFTFFVLFNNFVPINLYAVMELCNLIQGYFINADLMMYHEESDTPARTRSSNLCQELGQVEYIFSDKTGTLTQNVMKFMRCSVEGKIYGELGGPGFEIGASQIQTTIRDTPESKDARVLDMFLQVLAVAHTVFYT